MNKRTFLIGSLMLTSLVALPVFAETIGTTTPEHMPPAKVATPENMPKAKIAIDYACVQTAVDVRETAIASAFGDFTTAENAALAARKSALHDAWGMTINKTRVTARNKAWSDFRTANRAAFKALRSAHKSAWSAFGVSSKACHSPIVESHGEEGIGSLGL